MDEYIVHMQCTTAWELCLRIDSYFKVWEIKMNLKIKIKTINNIEPMGEWKSGLGVCGVR